MRSRSVNPQRNQRRRWPAHLVIAAGLAALIAAPADHAGALERRSERSIESIESRTAGEPIMAIVSLRKQRITVYDANSWIVRAPVSSGQKGRETPAGIFSIIQKEADHYSNLYDDAYMPHMQRITWSGIALHGGPLPGYPASHGCVRMPFDFAARLFEASRLSAPRRRQSPAWPSWTRNWRQRKRSCSRSSIASRVRAKHPSWQRLRGSRQSRRRARLHASSSRYRC